MKWSTLWTGAVKVGKFVVAHPEVFEVAAASTGHPGLAAGIGTVVAAKNAASAAKAPAAPVTQAPVEPAPVAPAPAPVTPDGPPPLSGVTVVPEVDLVGKWRGTLDHMSMEILNHRMTEDELYNNAKLLEAGDVAGVVKNLQEKK